MILHPAAVRYRFNSRFARFVRWLSRRPASSNWCVTIRCTCFVSGNHIEPRSRAHEYAHSAQWFEAGWLWFPVRYLWRLFLFGYQQHPDEEEARVYARVADLARFPRLPQ